MTIIPLPVGLSVVRKLMIKEINSDKRHVMISMMGYWSMENRLLGLEADMVG